MKEIEERCLLITKALMQMLAPWIAIAIIVVASLPR